MAKRNLSEALEQVEMTYRELNSIAKDMTDEIFAPINAIVDNINCNINNLTNDQIRDYMIQLGVRSFSLSEIKEKSITKAQCAEILRKEAYSESFNAVEGSIGVKDNKATLEVSGEMVAETLYDLVSSLFKSKVESIHKMIDVLKTVLMSRMSEAKLSANSID